MQVLGMGLRIRGNWAFLLKRLDYFRSAAIRCETSTQAARKAPLESNGMPNAAPAAADAIVVHREASESSGSAICMSVDSSEPWSEEAMNSGLSSLFCIASSLG